MAVPVNSTTLTPILGKGNHIPPLGVAENGLNWILSCSSKSYLCFPGFGVQSANQYCRSSSMALALHSLLRRPPFLHIPGSGGHVLLVSVTNSGVPPCTGIPGECPAGRAGLPHSNSGRPRGYLAVLNPGPAQPQRPQVVVVGSGEGTSHSPVPWLQPLPLASLARTGCLDQLQLTNQSPPSGLSPWQHSLGTWTAGAWSPSHSEPRDTRVHPTASLCHVAFPPGAGAPSSLGVQGRLSPQPSRKDCQERRATASIGGGK